MTLLQNKVALVTGGSRGIGRAISLRLAQYGAFVAIHYGSSRDAAESVLQEIKTGGGKGITVQANLEHGDAIDHLFAGLDKGLTGALGTDKFDILVNNAGIAPMVPFSETDPATFDKIFTVNVKAPFFVTQMALQRLRDGGRIIFTSSAVTRGYFANTTAYSSSKGAIDTLTKYLAAELGNRKITVNSVNPGAIESDMTASFMQDPTMRPQVAAFSPLNRIGVPDDIAKIVAFLASPDSEWITGQHIDGSGGWHL